MDAIALRKLFLKFEYQRRVAAGHLFGDEAAEVLRLGPLIQQTISHKLDQRAELLISQSDWGDQQRVEALEDWLNWAAATASTTSDVALRIRFICARTVGEPLQGRCWKTTGLTGKTAAGR